MTFRSSPGVHVGTVEGLDISEKPRTRATLKVYCALLSCAYLQPLASEQAYTAEDADASISSCLEPWADEFVARALLLLDHRQKPDDQNNQDTMLLLMTMQMFFAHISDKM